MQKYEKTINFNPIKKNFTKNNDRESKSKEEIDISKYKKTRMHVKKRIPLNL